MRKVLLSLHRYAGFGAGGFLVLIGITGSLLVFREEIDEFLNPGLFQVMPHDTTVSLQTVMQNVRQAFPHDTAIAIRLPRTREGTYEMWMNDEHGLRVYLDPYAGDILGSRLPNQTFTGWMFLLHTELLSGEIGETLIGISALVFLGLGVTGIILWWPGGHGFLSGFIIRRSSRKAVNYDVHKVTGIGAVCFLALISATGAAMVFYPTFQRMVASLTAAPPRPAQPQSTWRPGLTSLPLDLIVQKADAALPGAKTSWVSLPTSPHGIVKVRKRFMEELHPNGRSFVSLDQYTGDILLVEHALEAPLGTRIDNLLYPLHIGRFGVGMRILYLISGLAPAVLFVTGLFIWFKKQR